jgi:hypothetical protein
MRCFRAERFFGRYSRQFFERYLGQVAGRKILFCVLLAGLACAPVWTQQTTTPSLQNRSQGHRSQGEPGSANSASQLSNLPSDAWGAYEFDHAGESIELDLDRNRLSGYISRLGDAETDNNTPLTFFFDQSAIDGDEISFQTRVLHGIWYSFRGTIVRGDGKARGDEGYYVLRGVLAAHHPESGRDKSADETIERREVHFKSMPQ